MKKIKWMIAGLVAAGVVQAAEVDITVDFASAYIFRGVTLNRNAVMQPGAEISGFPIPEEYGALTVGTWANFDLSRGGSDSGLKRHEFSEIDYYVSYALPFSAVDLSVTYTEYTYPNSDDRSDREIAFGMGKEILDTGLYAELVANYGLAGGVMKDTYVEAGLEYGIEISEALSASIGATVGYLFNNGGPDGWHDASISLGLGYALTENWSISGSVAYVAQLDSNVLDNDAYDRKAYAMIGLAYSF